MITSVLSTEYAGERGLFKSIDSNVRLYFPTGAFRLKTTVASDALLEIVAQEYSEPTFYLRLMSSTFVISNPVSVWMWSMIRSVGCPC